MPAFDDNYLKVHLKILPIFDVHRKQQFNNEIWILYLTWKCLY